MDFSSFTAKADRLFEDISMLESKLNTVDQDPITDSENSAEIILNDDFYPSAETSAWAARLNAQQVLNF
jgi:hypothetical protein